MLSWKARLSASMAVRHRSHGDDADDDAQRRQDRAHFVGANGVPRNAQAFLDFDEKIHGGIVALLRAQSLGDQPVADADDAPGVPRDVLLVGDDKNGVALVGEDAQQAP